MEILLRKLIPKLKLYNFNVLIKTYEKYAGIRYKSKFNSEIKFRGSCFVIGKDVTLFPSVYHGTYEKTELDILLNKSFPKNFVFWDVGANIGLYSVILGKRLTSGQVISFEPNKNLHSLLVNNFALNNVSKYIIEGKALSNHSGQGVIFSENSRPGAGRIKVNSKTVKPVEQFEIVSGDEYLRLHPERIPGLIKIDVEGHEPEVIKGMSKILVTHKPALALEVFKNLWESERAFLWSEVLNFLFEVYGDSLLITDGSVKKITKWDPDFLTGGLQTLMFGIDKVDS